MSTTETSLEIAALDRISAALRDQAGRNLEAAARIGDGLGDLRRSLAALRAG